MGCYLRVSIHPGLDVLKQVFKLKEYLIQFIDKYMKQFLQKLFESKVIQDTVKILLTVTISRVFQSLLIKEGQQSCIKNHLPCCS